MADPWKQAFLLTKQGVIEHTIAPEKEYLLLLAHPGERAGVARYGLVQVFFSPRLASLAEELTPEVRVLCAGRLESELEAFLSEYDLLNLPWVHTLCPQGIAALPQAFEALRQAQVRLEDLGIAENREDGGRLLRAFWIEYVLRTQTDPKPSHVAPWGKMPEPDREAARYMWENLVAPYARDVARLLEERTTLEERYRLTLSLLGKWCAVGQLAQKGTFADETMAGKLEALQARTQECLAGQLRDDDPLAFLVNENAKE